MYALILCLCCGIALGTTCCTGTELSLKQSFHENDVAVYARVRTIVEQRGAFSVELELIEIFKANLYERSKLQTDKIVASLTCGAGHMPNELVAGIEGVFFGKIATRASVLSLRPCDKIGPISSCERANLRSGSFTNCKAPKPPAECQCSEGRKLGSTWRTGRFDCYKCTCAKNAVTCDISCSIEPACILIPSTITGLILIVIIAFATIIIRLCRARSRDDSTEMSDITTPDVTTTYPYHPPTSTNHIFMTDQGPLNTQPMVMMTQNGEPVIVQVAYL